MLGAPKSARGSTSILLVNDPEFDEERGRLLLNAEGVSVLNLGTTARTIVIDAGLELAAKVPNNEPGHFGPGDREFIMLVESELTGEAQEVAMDLLRALRKKEPGDLKRGERNNFSNTPDNFWYVNAQPRVQALLITVRGASDRFGASPLRTENRQTWIHSAL